MPKRSRQPLEKLTINLREGDLAWLQENMTPPGAGPVVRTLVSKFVDGQRALEASGEKPHNPWLPQ